MDKMSLLKKSLDQATKFEVVFNSPQVKIDLLDALWNADLNGDMKIAGPDETYTLYRTQHRFFGDDLFTIESCEDALIHETLDPEYLAISLSRALEVMHFERQVGGKIATSPHIVSDELKAEIRDYVIKQYNIDTEIIAYIHNLTPVEKAVVDGYMDGVYEDATNRFIAAYSDNNVRHIVEETPVIDTGQLTPFAPEAYCESSVGVKAGVEL